MYLPVLALAALSALQGPRHAQPAATFAAAEVEHGALVDLRIAFAMDPGWHIYHPDDNSGQGLPPSVTLSGEGFAAAGPLTTASAPKVHTDKLGNQTITQRWLEGRVELVMPVRVTASPGAAQVEVVVKWMECDVRICLPPTQKSFPLSIVVKPGAVGAAPPLQTGVEPLPEPTGTVKAEYDFTNNWRQGDTYPLEFSLKPMPGWHIYHPDSPSGYPTQVEFIGSGFEVVGKPRTASKPRIQIESFGDEYHWLDGEPEFEVEVKVTGDPAQAGGLLRITWMACTESSCLYAEGVEFPVGNPGAGAAGTAKAGLADEGFWSFLLLAIGAGLFTLLTPCVFPMIPVTISYFTKRADDGKGTPLGNASAYAGGIIFTFAGIGVGAALLIGPFGANAIGSNPWVNLGIGLLFVWMALSLLGFYEIQAPRFLQNFASKTQSDGRKQAGYLPVVLMAIAFSITAFTCTVGFVGAIFATGLNLGYGYLLGGMLVYGAVFALPFFFLAMFPSYLKSLPQAGGWMNTVKVSAGFIELVAAIKFFSNTDLRYKLHVMTWPVALGLTIFFLLLWAAYMFGLYRTHHDYAKIKPSKGRLAVGVLALGSAGFLAPGLWERSENAFAGGWVEAYMPPPEYGIERYAIDGGVIKAGGLSWQEDFGRAWDIGIEQGRPVFVDFTGVTCVNCRKMEYDIFPHAAVLPLLGRMARAELWVDRPPFGKWNASLEVERFKAAAQPYYAILDPRDDAVLAEKDGYDPNPAAFVAFLEQGLNAYAARTPGPLPEGGAWHQRRPIPEVAESHFPWIGSLALLALVAALAVWLIVALLRAEAQKRREDRK
jgi:thiol:disulfide interchange protein DsbD